MPELTTILVALKSVAPALLKAAPWLWKTLPRNTPIGKAIAVTVGQYSSRIPSFEADLEAWVMCDAFRAHVEAIEGGALIGADASHVDLFIRTTGCGLGLSSPETVAEGLGFFYSELCGQLLDGEHGMRFLGTMVQTQNREMMDLLKSRPGPGTESLSYRPAVETDATSRATTEEDRKANITLDSIKVLIDTRRTSAALSLLATLQDSVDKGHVSSPVRFRFIVNKGVCLMLEGKWDEAEAEFEAAQILEPNNRKALINLAQVAHFRGRQNEALAYVERVLSQDPSDPSANALRLACLYELGRGDEVQAALEAQPALADDGVVLYTLAYIALDQQKFDEAELYLRRHNKVDETYPEAWEMLGRAIVIPAQRQLQQTAASTNRIPDDLRERIEEAESCFTRAEELLQAADSRRELKLTAMNRGVARTLLGHFEAARQDFETALRIDPSMEDLKRNLGSLCLHMGKPAEALQFFEQIQSSALRAEVSPLMAAAYLALKQPASARAVLAPIIDSDHPDEKLFVEDLYIQACQKMGETVECEARLASLSSRSGSPAARRIEADYHVRQRNWDQAITCARQAAELAPDPLKPRYQLMLADTLFRADRFGEAAEIYQLLPIPSDESSESRQRLISLYNSGRLQKALEVAQAVRNGGSAIADFSEIEALVFERAGSPATANRLRSELLDAGAHPERQKLRMAINHFRMGENDHAASRTLDVSLDSIASDSESLRDAAMLRTLLGLPDALVFAYRLLQQDPNSPEAHVFYVNTFLRREEVDHSLLNPETVGKDCEVALCRGAEKQALTIVEGESDTAKDWISTEHDLAKHLVGKRAGDKFRFPEGEPTEAEYEIKGVQSKYVRAFQECMGRFNVRFPAHYGLTRIDVKDDDITQIVLMLERQRAHADLILSFYSNGQLPSCAAARLFGKSDVETFRALVQDPRIKVLSYYGSLARMGEETAALSVARAILLEASALVTLQSLGLLLKVAAAVDRVCVTQQQVDALAEAVASLFPEKQTGHLFSDSPGHIQMVSRTSEEAIREQGFYQQLLSFVRTNCQVLAPGGEVGLGHFGKVEDQSILGSAALSAISTSAESGILLVSDDLPLRSLARNSYAVVTAGTLSLLKCLRTRSVISEDEYHEAVQWLVGRGFSFVSVDNRDLIWVLKRNGWSPKGEVAAILQALTGPGCNQQDALSVGLDVLHEIWAEPLPPATQQLTSDLLLLALVTGRNGLEVLHALEAMNRRRSLIWTPATEQIRSVIRSWRSNRGRSILN
ncbi:MAG: hypothetical protein C0504_06240 [Candidatus Solibacter sp.]|nr:hypothetical protein [Candidatus Solibacter sp.]